ncbi:SusC/RagA family TonB-linked outer membrane protein [Gangjinia marincola]|uniref:SusC/RagA family TonB-linked outer membrane protein n=1 Tax=Gangjinia marincola TaxID=578463 RepID=A0ABP3XVR1_9FLAO
MKTKLLKKVCFLLFLAISTAWAQEKSIQGTVVDNNGLPLPGVNIVIKNSSIGTQTDFDGNYTITASTGQTLVFSYQGFKNKEVQVTDANEINVQFEEDVAILNEVVVTAQGIKREKRALGFAQTNVETEELEQRPNADVAKTLQGKIAGVQISQTGVIGGGSGITIRANTSITGNNQALFVVDGVPINSGSDDDGFTGAGAIDSNRLIDIDPNNIESMSVLKGLAASVLYGNQGRNGVILITTKTGNALSEKSKKLNVTYSNSIYFNTIANLPDFQNKYGSGFYLSNLNGANGSFGPEFDGQIVPNILSNNSALQDSFPEFFDDPSTPDVIEGGVPYSATPNNVEDFFRIGLGRNIGISVSKSTENMSFSTSYSNTSEEGFIPLNKLRRDNFSIGGSVKLANNFTATGTFNYVINEIEAPPITAANGANAFSIFERLLFIPRNFDINNLPFEDPVDGSNVYYLNAVDNPKWVLNNSLSTQKVNRFFNSVSLKYDFNDHINLTYRLGLDSFNERQSFYVNRGSSDGNAIYANGYLRVRYLERQQWDHSLILTSNYKLNDDFGLAVIAGANSNRRTIFREGTIYQDQVLRDNFRPFNFETVSNIDPFTGTQIDFEEEINILGVYAQLEFDYKNFAYLTLAARNDWGSLLEAEENSVFYPSISGSFIPTTAFSDMRSDFLSYLKLRGNVASGVQFPDDAYTTRPVLSTNSNAFGTGGVVTQSVSNLVPNRDLKAATLVDYEIGIESRFIKNRVSLTANAYLRNISDQIFQQEIGAETGATSTFVNIGESETRGLEIELDINPIRTENFRWDLSSRFFAYETEVLELPEGIDQLAIGGFTDLGNFAIEGEPLGVIVGSFAVRDQNGNLIIDPNNGEVIPNSAVGLPDKIIGDPNPDWTNTLINTFSYKGLSLSAQLEYRHGGDIYSLTAQNLYFRGVVDIEGIDRDFYASAIPGVLAQTDENGNILTTTNQEGEIDGVLLQQGGDGNPIENNILLPYEDTIFNNLEQNAAENIFDGSLIRLRELSMSYQLPAKLLEKTPLGSLSLKLYGQNLWFDAINFPDALNYDVEVGSTGVGNASGLDFQTSPSAKSVGFAIKASF